MAIKFQCACGRKLKAGDELAGRRGKCPGCGTQFIIPFVAEPLRSQLPADETFAEYIPPPTDSAASSTDSATSSTLWSALPVIAPITASVGDVLPVEFDSRHQMLSEAQVVPDSSRCVQCGICSHNCPMGIDVRGHARRGLAIHESWRLMPQSWSVGARDDVNRIRLVLDEHTLIGALVMREQTWSHPLQQLVIGQMDLTPIRGALLAGGAASLEHLAAFHQDWRQQTRNRS